MTRTKQERKALLAYAKWWRDVWATQDSKTHEVSEGMELMLGNSDGAEFSETHTAYRKYSGLMDYAQIAESMAYEGMEVK